MALHTKLIPLLGIATIGLAHASCRPRLDNSSGLLTAGASGAIDVATVGRPKAIEVSADPMIFDITSSKAGVSMLRFGVDCPTPPPPPAPQVVPGVGVVTLRDATGAVISSFQTLGDDRRPSFALQTATDKAGYAAVLEINHQGRWEKAKCRLRYYGEDFLEFGTKSNGPAGPTIEVTKLDAGATDSKDTFKVAQTGLFDIQYTVSTTKFASGVTDNNGDIVTTGTVASFPTPGSKSLSGKNVCSAPLSVQGATLTELPPAPATPLAPIDITKEMTKQNRSSCERSLSMFLDVDKANTNFEVSTKLNPFAFAIVKSVEVTVRPHSVSGLALQNVRTTLATEHDDEEGGVTMSGRPSNGDFVKSNGDLSASVFFKNDVPQQEVVIHGYANMMFALNKASTAPELRLQITRADGIFSQDLPLRDSINGDYEIAAPIRLPNVADYVISWRILNFLPGMLFQITLTPTIERFSVPERTPEMIAKVKNAAGGDNVTLGPVLDAGGQEVFPRRYHDDEGMGPRPKPASPFGKFQGMTVLEALEGIRRKWHVVIPDGTTPDPNFNMTTAGDITGCLGNNPAHWSDIMMHYYCQLPGNEIRACYTNTVRSLASALEGLPKGSPGRIALEVKQRDQAIDECVASQPTRGSAREILGWKWLTEESFTVNGVSVKHLDVFKYVMNSQTFAYSSYDQENVLNAFYRVAPTASGAIEFAACKRARPPRSQDDASANYCLPYDICKDGASTCSSADQLPAGAFKTMGSPHLTSLGR